MRMIFLFKYDVIGLVLLCGALALVPALDPGHAGPALVIDGDTIVIDGEKHRLYGVDAVELDQTCVTREGRVWPCGREAAQALSDFLVGRRVNCEPVGRDDDGRRNSSICYAGKDNLSAWIAREGWAVADPSAIRVHNYSSEAGTARFLRNGIWSGTLEMPEDWRRKHQ